MGSGFIIPFYTPLDVSFIRGEGVYLYDEHGKRYLDFGSGVAASSLGHCHPSLVEALEKQVKTLWHVSNMYTISEAERLAEQIVGLSFADMAFFGNSGAEAVECGFKIARSYQSGIGRAERYKILTLRRSFHGRTYAACSASEPKGFLPRLYPYVDWFVNVNPDINIIRDEVEKGGVGTILVEPVQGEGGVRILSSELLKGLRELCDEHDVLLFFDCVQCGSGRTGKFFAHEHTGVTPDICSLGKGLGSGFPVGACLITERAGRFVVPRLHGSTCGGNPLATTVAYTVINEILKPGFLESVINNGNYAMKRLSSAASKFPKLIEEVRGVGLMIGLQITSTVDVRDIARRLLEHNVLVAPAYSDNTLRIVPPLITTHGEIDEFMDIFESFLPTISL